MASLLRLCVFGLAGLAPVLAKRTAGAQSANLHVGEPAGEFKNISGVPTYHTYPSNPTNSTTAILFLTDIFGVPLLENKLLADALTTSSNPVIMPDLFRGDAVPSNNPEATLNLTAWRARHPQSDIELIITNTIQYMRSQLGITRIGAVGYCFGGKYVPRFMAGKGVDVGFIAHPSGLETSEIEAIAGAISIAAGELDAAFNASARRTAEDILTRKNTTYQTTLYSGAPHGFGVRVDLSVPRQKYAKEASFTQAVQWFQAWL